MKRGGFAIIPALVGDTSVPDPDRARSLSEYLKETAPAKAEETEAAEGFIEKVNRQTQELAEKMKALEAMMAEPLM